MMKLKSHDMYDNKMDGRSLVKKHPSNISSSRREDIMVETYIPLTLPYPPAAAGRRGVQNGGTGFSSLTMAMVHRKKYTTNLDGYYNYFEIVSGLPKRNFILLSKNLHLDLSKYTNEEFQCTESFEDMIKTLAKY
jgi:hypothetical protein